jgi:hypothetical protein
MVGDHDGWLLCDGRRMQRADFPKLYDVIGKSFDNEEQIDGLFALPNNLSVSFGEPGDVNGFIYSGVKTQKFTTISSKNILTDEGYTVGETIEKDMDTADYTAEFDPHEYQDQLFPNLKPFVSRNIVKQPGQTVPQASYWDDWGNDIFDDWGYFFIYNVSSGKYYFPLFQPQNQNDGVITTQKFKFNSSTFTIKHGFPVQGVFKLDISVNNANTPFIFGAYGDMGSDGSEDGSKGMAHSYKRGSHNPNSTPCGLSTSREPRQIFIRRGLC